MVTASAEMDPTLYNDIDIGNQICVLVATQGDDNLLNPSSFQEENVDKLCIALGHEPMEGVLCLLDTEVVLAYQHEPDMIATMCHLTAATIR